MALFGKRNPFIKRDALEVKLPHTFTRDSLYFVVTKLFEGLEARPNKVVLDFANLERIQVGGVAVLSNMIELYKKARIKKEFINVSSCAAKAFLNGAGFLALYSEAELQPGAVSQEFLPLKLVEYARSHSYLNQELVPWIARLLEADVRALSSLKVCFEEIFNNIKDHSTVNVGGSCAHYDEADKKMTICISDFGVGIPTKVRAKMEINTDQGAIAMACQEGFTTRSTPGNMGAGLHVLIRNVVTRNAGSVIIYSGKGIYSCTPGKPGGLVKRTGRPAPHGGLYPGTMIYMTLDMKKFVPSEIDGEEFAWE